MCVFPGIPLQEEHIHYPENVHGDEENQIEDSKKCKQFTYFGSICRQIFTIVGLLITFHLSSYTYLVIISLLTILLTYDSNQKLLYIVYVTGALGQRLHIMLWMALTHLGKY